MATSERTYPSAVTTTADERRRVIALNATVLFCGIRDLSAAAAIDIAQQFEAYLRGDE